MNREEGEGEKGKEKGGEKRGRERGRREGSTSFDKFIKVVLCTKERIISNYYRLY